jgi:hypothetical protein
MKLVLNFYGLKIKKRERYTSGGVIKKTLKPLVYYLREIACQYDIESLKHFLMCPGYNNSLVVITQTEGVVFSAKSISLEIVSPRGEEFIIKIP